MVKNDALLYQSEVAGLNARERGGECDPPPFFERDPGMAVVSPPKAVHNDQPGTS